MLALERTMLALCSVAYVVMFAWFRSFVITLNLHGNLKGRSVKTAPIKEMNNEKQSESLPPLANSIIQHTNVSFGVMQIFF